MMKISAIVASISAANAFGPSFMRRTDVVAPCGGILEQPCNTDHNNGCNADLTLDARDYSPSNSGCPGPADTVTLCDGSLSKWVSSGGYCCPASCGTCGGPGCNSREGGAACCHSRIKASGIQCLTPTDNACMIPDQGAEAPACCTPCGGHTGLPCQLESLEAGSSMAANQGCGPGTSLVSDSRCGDGDASCCLQDQEEEEEEEPTPGSGCVRIAGNINDVWCQTNCYSPGTTSMNQACYLYGGYKAHYHICECGGPVKRTPAAASDCKSINEQTSDASCVSTCFNGAGVNSAHCAVDGNEVAYYHTCECNAD